MKTLKESILGKRDFNKINDTIKELQKIRNIFNKFIQKKCPNKGVYDKIMSGYILSSNSNELVDARILTFYSKIDGWLDINHKSRTDVCRIFRDLIINNLGRPLSEYDVRIDPIKSHGLDCNDNETKYTYSLTFTYNDILYIAEFLLYTDLIKPRNERVINEFAIRMNKDLFALITGEPDK